MMRKAHRGVRSLAHEESRENSRAVRVQRMPVGACESHMRKDSEHFGLEGAG